MSDEKLYSADEVCKELNITIYTLSNWYIWEKKKIKDGAVDKEYLPKPLKLEHTKGSPRRWTINMINDLKEFQKSIVTGRNGTFGVYSNPYHKETKKYKKSIETLESK